MINNLSLEEKQVRINELNQEITNNSEDYNNGSISYEELHNLQNPLIKERDELLK